MNQDLKKLQWVPFGTPEHDKIVSRIQKDIKSRDYILCTQGMYEKDRCPLMDRNALANAPKQGLQTPFDGDVGVFTSDKYYFVRRDRAEYNLHHRQINVGLLITDMKGRALVLEKNNKYLSLVGGHTDFTRQAYDMTIAELCHFNVMKEFGEEVKYTGKIEVPTKPYLFITEGHEMWDYFHAWFIYHVEVKDLDVYKFKSNEKDKHVTQIISIETLHANDGQFKIKNSLWQSINTLVHFGKARIKVHMPEKEVLLNK